MWVGLDGDFAARLKPTQSFCRIRAIGLRKCALATGRLSCLSYRQADTVRNRDRQSLSQKCRSRRSAQTIPELRAVEFRQIAIQLRRHRRPHLPVRMFDAIFHRRTIGKLLVCHNSHCFAEPVSRVSRRVRLYGRWPEHLKPSRGVHCASFNALNSRCAVASAEPSLFNATATKAPASGAYATTALMPGQPPLWPSQTSVQPSGLGTS